MTALTGRARPRLSPRELAIVWTSFLIVAVLTADVVVGGPVTHVDGDLRDAIQPRADTAPWWLSAVASLGDLRYAIPIVAAGALAASHYAWRPWPAGFAVGAFASVELAVLALKAAVGRPGPGMWTDRAGYPGYFPSGHAATATAVVAIAVFIASRLGLFRLPRTAPIETCVVVGAVAGALAGIRAVLGDTHWASDVIGGVLLSAGVLVPAMAVCRDILDGPPRNPQEPVGHGG